MFLSPPSRCLAFDVHAHVPQGPTTADLAALESQGPGVQWDDDRLVLPDDCAAVAGVIMDDDVTTTGQCHLPLGPTPGGAV